MGRSVKHRTIQRVLRSGVFYGALAVALVAVAGWLYYNEVYVGNFSCVRPGVLYRSRQPCGRQWSVLERAEIKRVVNLRVVVEGPEDFDEEVQACKEAGVELVHIPVGAILPTEEDVEKFLVTVRSSPGAVLVHCAHGRARTGFVVAAWRVVMDGWTPEEAIEEMLREGDDPDPPKRAMIVERLTAMHRNRQRWLSRTDPDALDAGRPAPVAASRPR